MKFNFSKDKFKELYISLALLFLLLSTNIVTIFKIFYNQISYGLFNGTFRLSLSIIYLLIGLLIITKVFKIKFTPKKELLSTKRVLLLYALTLIPIIIMSAALGWEVKVFFDIGSNSTGTSIIEHFINVLLIIPKMFIVTLIIHYIQIFVSNVVEFDNEKIAKYTPFGGIFIFLTFGLFELICGVHHFNIFYLIVNLYFGLIYLLTNKSVPKSFFIITLIYLL